MIAGTLHSVEVKMCDLEDPGQLEGHSEVTGHVKFSCVCSKLELAT